MAAEHEARLERTADHGPDTRSLFLRLEHPLRFLPGQFISCLLPVGGERLTRPYSIASDPESPHEIELLLAAMRSPAAPRSTTCASATT